MAEANTALGTIFTGAQGAAAADALCQGQASTADLSGTYTAWLSLPGSNAIDRLGQNAVGYALTDGTADLLDGSLAAPINRDEFGAIVGTGGLEWTVWTNTVISGRESSGGGSTCQGFTSSTSADLGVVGDARAIGNGSGAPQGSWTRANNLPCSARARLFCFQQ